jgi:sulfite reductase beta subunit-like hemoprotein
MGRELRLDIEAIDKFAGRYALGYERGEGSSHFLRIKIVGGELTIEQAKVIAELSEKYGHGYLEITTRHDIQLHWIKDEDAPEIFAKLEEVGLNTDMCGQAYPEAKYGDVRNIVTCPVSGIQKDELFNTLPIVKEAVKFFTGKQEYLDLPRKFKIAISACPLNCVRPEINDLGLVAIKSSYGLGFTPFIGGGIGIPPMLAKPMNIYVGLNEVLDFMKAIVEIYRDYGNRKSKAKARFKWMIEEFGIEKIRKLIEMKIGKQLRFFDTKNINLKWGDHIGYQPQKQEGFYFIVVPILAGFLNVKQFKKILELVNKYGGNKIRVSPLQKLILIDIPKDKLSMVIKELENIGFNLNHPPIRWTTIACPTNFCGKALENVKNRAIEIEEHLEKIFGMKLKELKLRIAISGCPNSCAHHRIAEIGLQATAIKKNGIIKPAYDIYLRGELSNISQLFLKNILAEDVKYEIEKLIKMYLDGNFSSFYKFAEKCLKEKVNYGS